MTQHKEQEFLGNHSQISTGRGLTQRWVGSAIGELRVRVCTLPRLGMGPSLTGAEPGGGRMGSAGSQVSISCNIDRVMEYCTLPLLVLLLVPPGARIASSAAGTSLDTVRTPCPLSSALLTARPFTRGHKARPTEEEVGTMEPAIHSWRLAEGGGGRWWGLPGVRRDRQKG